MTPKINTDTWRKGGGHSENQHILVPRKNFGWWFLHARHQYHVNRNYIVTCRRRTHRGRAQVHMNIEDEIGAAKWEEQICLWEASPVAPASSDWVITSYPRAVKSQWQKKGGHQSMAPLQGTTAAVYPPWLAGCQAFPTHPVMHRQAGRQVGRQERRLASYLPFPSLFFPAWAQQQVKLIPWACRHQDANKWAKETSSSSRRWWWVEGGATGMRERERERERVKPGFQKFRPVFWIFLLFQ
jgi:hypothetical protein